MKYSVTIKKRFDVELKIKVTEIELTAHDAASPEEALKQAWKLESALDKEGKKIKTEKPEEQPTSDPRFPEETVPSGNDTGKLD